MTEEESNKKIQELKSQLTGNLFNDSEIHYKIYLLSKNLKSAKIPTNFPEINGGGCQSCGQ